MFKIIVEVEGHIKTYCHRKVEKADQHWNKIQQKGLHAWYKNEEGHVIAEQNHGALVIAEKHKASFKTAYSPKTMTYQKSIDFRSYKHTT